MRTTRESLELLLAERGTQHEEWAAESARGVAGVTVPSFAVRSALDSSSSGLAK